MNCGFVHLRNRHLNPTCQYIMPFVFWFFKWKSLFKFKAGEGVYPDGYGTCVPYQSTWVQFPGSGSASC